MLEVKQHEDGKVCTKVGKPRAGTGEGKFCGWEQNFFTFEDNVPVKKKKKIWSRYTWIGFAPLYSYFCQYRAGI